VFDARAIDVLRGIFTDVCSDAQATLVDGVRFEDIEAYGLERWLEELTQDLRKETYKPEAIRRVYIPKPNGKLRPLGIATLWSPSYLASSCGGAPISIVRQYIEQQKTP